MSYVLVLDWSAVRDFLDRRPVVPTVAGSVIGRPVVLPVAGSAEWCALDDDDPAKAGALMVAGSRWVLEEEIAEIHERQQALKEAATAISEVKAWASVARFVRDRDRFYRDNPDLRRKQVS